MTVLDETACERDAVEGVPECDDNPGVFDATVANDDLEEAFAKLNVSLAPTIKMAICRSWLRIAVSLQMALVRAGNDEDITLFGARRMTRDLARRELTHAKMASMREGGRRAPWGLPAALRPRCPALEARARLRGSAAGSRR
jgi:hypothetical protein